MAKLFAREARSHRADPHYFIAGMVLIIAIVIIVVVSLASFRGSFDSQRTLIVQSDRAGLVMDVGAKVKMRGVTIGKVAKVESDGGLAQLKLDIMPSELGRIPANVSAQIKASTAFGAKYVALIPPADPTGTISEGARIRSTNVTTEVNTLFENLTSVMQTIDPAKLNSILGGISAGLRDRGPALGETIREGNEFLGEINPVMPQLKRDFSLAATVANTYGDAAGDLTNLLENATVTSRTVVDEQKNLDALLVSVIGLGDSGSDLLKVSGQNFVDSARLLVPTTDLLRKYSPSYKCVADQAAYALRDGMGKFGGGNNGYSLDLDVALLLGDNPYKYPQNLPKVNAKGGPGGAPGCYGAITKQNYPAPYLVTDTGASIADTTTLRPGSPLFQQYLFGPMTGGPAK